MIISPFVEIVSGRLEEVVDNKFAGGKIAPETLERFIAGFASTRALARKFTPPSRTTILTLPSFFAMPTDSEWEDFEKKTKWNKESVEELVKSYAGEGAVPRTDNQGFNIYLPRVASFPEESSEPLLLYAHNTGDCKALADDAPKVLNPEMLLGVARSTPDEGCGVESLLEAAREAELEAVCNLESGHGRPVYLLSLGVTKWLYGVFVIEGSVRVSGGYEGVNEITPSDYEAYLASCKTTSAARVVSREELMEKLSGALEVVSKRPEFEGKRALLYPRKYVVGKLYLPEAGAPGFDLPGEDSLSTPGGLLLCEGLMRMVLGDEVLTWSREQAEMAYLLRIPVNKSRAGADVEPLLNTPRRLLWCLRALLGSRVEPARAIDEGLEKSAGDVVELFRLAPEETVFRLLKKIAGVFPKNRLRELLEEISNRPEQEPEPERTKSPVERQGSEV